MSKSLFHQLRDDGRLFPGLPRLGHTPPLPGTSKPRRDGVYEVTRKRLCRDEYHTEFAAFVNGEWRRGGCLSNAAARAQEPQRRTECVEYEEVVYCKGVVAWRGVTQAEHDRRNDRLLQQTDLGDDFLT